MGLPFWKIWPWGSVSLPVSTAPPAASIWPWVHARLKLGGEFGAAVCHTVV